MNLEELGDLRVLRGKILWTTQKQNVGAGFLLENNLRGGKRQ